jgi:hypothetical protein
LPCSDDKVASKAGHAQVDVTARIESARSNSVKSPRRATTDLQSAMAMAGADTR